MGAKRAQKTTSLEQWHGNTSQFCRLVSKTGKNWFRTSSISSGSGFTSEQRVAFMLLLAEKRGGRGVLQKAEKAK